MKKMKILTLLLCATLAFAYMGCSNSSGGSGGSGNNGGGITPKLPTAISAGENGTAGTTGTYVYFGEWPQTQLTGSITVDESNSKPVGMFTYYKGSDNAWYAKVSSNYYKVEPIKWRVLNPAATGSEKKILLAENILINCKYYDYYNVNRTIGNATVYPNNYEHSRVRAFLNGLGYQKKAFDSAEQTSETEFEGKGFLQTAFTAEEIASIAETSVDNSARTTNPDANATQWNNGNNQYKSNTTIDKIFLLSEQEVTNTDYGFVAYNASGTGNTRIRMTTAFAQANGASQNSTEGYGGYWLLRSPHYNYSYYARTVSDVGHAIDNLSGVTGDIYGVVPALCLN